DVAAGIARTRVLDLDHVGAHPGERLGAGRTRFELGEVEDLHAGKAILSAHLARSRFCRRAHYSRGGRCVETVPHAPPSPASGGGEGALWRSGQISLLGEGGHIRRAPGRGIARAGWQWRTR